MFSTNIEKSLLTILIIFLISILIYCIFFKNRIIEGNNNVYSIEDIQKIQEINDKETELENISNLFAKKDNTTINVDEEEKKWKLDTFKEELNRDVDSFQDETKTKYKTITSQAKTIAQLRKDLFTSWENATNEISFNEFFNKYILIKHYDQFVSKLCPVIEAMEKFDTSDINSLSSSNLGAVEGNAIHTIFQVAILLNVYIIDKDSSKNLSNTENTWNDWTKLLSDAELTELFDKAITIYQTSNPTLETDVKISEQVNYTIDKHSTIFTLLNNLTSSSEYTETYTFKDIFIDYVLLIEKMKQYNKLRKNISPCGKEKNWWNIF